MHIQVYKFSFAIFKCFYENWILGAFLDKIRSSYNGFMDVIFAGPPRHELSKFLERLRTKIELNPIGSIKPNLNMPNQSWSNKTSHLGNP